MNWTKLGYSITKKYKQILFLSLLITLGFGFLMSKLEIKTQMTDMLPQNEPLVENFNNVTNNFDAYNTVIIGIEGEQKNIEKFIEKMTIDLTSISGVDRIVSNNYNEFIRENFFLLTKKNDLESMKTLLISNDLATFLNGLSENFEKTYTESGDSDKMKDDKQEIIGFLQIIENFLFALKKNDTTQAKILADAFISGQNYIIAPDRKMGLLFVKTSVSTLDSDGTIQLINGIEETLFSTQKEFNVVANVTGMHAIQRDEIVSTTKDMGQSSLFSFILIFLIFLIGFRLLRYSLLSVIPLILGIIWSMGLTYLFIGYLNLMTSMMGAILIGLGIDYSIHIISMFNEKRKEGESVQNAIDYVFAKAIPGVVSGSITTALGFLVFAFSSFKAFSEFGIVLGVGILCTLVASVFVLPSLLMIFGKKDVSTKKSNHLFSDIEGKVIQGRWIIIFLAIGLFIFSFFQFKNVKFETDMMKIEPKGLASIALNEKIIDKFEFASDNSTIVTSSIGELRDLKEKIEDLTTVGSFDSIISFLPESEKQKLRMQYGAELQKLRKSTPSYKLNKEAFEEALFRLQDNLIEMSDLAFAGAENKIVTACDTILNSNIFNSLNENFNEEKYSHFQHKFMSNYHQNIMNSNVDNLITLENLPTKIKENYVGKKNQFLANIYPSQDVWKQPFQNLHVKQLEPYLENLSGNVMVMLKVIETSGKEGKKVMLWTVVLIFLILLLDLRNFKYAILAMFPMLFSFVILLGIMGFFGVKFNLMSVIALPMIIGIGVDDGIHLIHRYRIERKLLPTMQSTGKAILLTTLTTISAFGTLMFSTYRGFIGYGLLLTIGIGLAYLMTVGFLVCLISVIDKVKE